MSCMSFSVLLVYADAPDVTGHVESDAPDTSRLGINKSEDGTG